MSLQYDRKRHLRYDPAWYEGRDFWWRWRLYSMAPAFSRPGIRWLITGKLP